MISLEAATATVIEKNRFFLQSIEKVTDGFFEISLIFSRKTLAQYKTSAIP
ncbi:hypothetical protein LEP1GSC188_3443 [Leptospira weilii serovar Topaz str. LT2116]|uniref:Uncharacterized protein n=1 Tax=Leptospira weilii serovar Topaz str. LT2116 TaxID=1088540 RepID=M3EJ88_9LEPT|nr:hypothetical protein LEP1GSC188_3443 [Leptospira weilii serovar Topaz str. LT2116]